MTVMVDTRLLGARSCCVSNDRCPDAMASSHSSTSVPRPSGGGGSHGIYRKDRERDASSRHYKPARSLPDVNLPAALNDPRLAKRESDFFTKTWGLDFVETEVMPSFYLPNITKEHFTPYLQETSQRERIHERCKSICPTKDELDSVSNITNNHDKSRTELEQVPKIFMKPDFALDDPTTFNAVLPWSHFSIAGGKGSRDMASSRLLQEKLSHYLDVVEVSIAHQISLRSEAFFHAMSSQHELQDRLRETARAVAALRERTATMERVMCEGPLRALRQALTRNNCLKLQNKLKLMAAVHQTQPTVQLLLSTSEFVGALELISTTQEVLQQELQGILSFRPRAVCGSPPSRVSSLSLLRHLGSQLCEMEKLIDKMMIADFTTYARSDLNRPLEEDAQVLEKDRLESLVFGLLRQRKLDFLEIYSEEMIAAAKGIVKQCVMNTVSQIEEIDTEMVVKLADQMRLMTFSQWFELLKSVFASFILFLRRIKATLSVIRNVVLEVLDSNQRNKLPEVAAAATTTEGSSGTPVPRESEVAYLTHEGMFISDAFSEAEQTGGSAPGTAPGAEARSLRPPQQSRTEPCGSDSASGTTESSSSREHTNPSSTPAGGAGITVSEDMMPTDLELGRVAANIQELMYTASDVSHDRCVKFLMARAKDLVNSIADGRITLPEKKPTGTEDRKPNDYLTVDGQKYAVVGTVLLLIRIFLEYCQCVNDIPSITTDMLTRLSDLLKHFNSRSCQLVLGAGALQVVGLKTITTKNLALASRCLQLVVHYIPIIRAHFETKLQPKQYSILRHFDHITKDYNDHIAEISAKLVAIMDSLFEKVLSKYEVKAPMPSSCFRNLARLSVVNDGGPQHGLVMVDVAFYTGNVQALKSLEHLDLNMAEIWELKR
ncbi:hypothetical protein JZ751_027588 [Albula glossodonta]|uniref:Vacuolar protein sorting-associated protein 54 n=1 Tax=Albula glossodonta TaxID=121402 RepID=A0A8T2NN14_9TELE|nr:hypothetical protein JZ751_027588 [Albula glossodonta]